MITEVPGGRNTHGTGYLRKYVNFVRNILQVSKPGGWVTVGSQYCVPTPIYQIYWKKILVPKLRLPPQRLFVSIFLGEFDINLLVVILMECLILRQGNKCGIPCWKRDSQFFGSPVYIWEV